MNKNSLKQMIVAEMIYADARKLMTESHKKRSLFEMMDDDYLDELDDRKFVYSMKMMLEDGADDWDIANSNNPNSGDNRKPVVAPASVADPETVDYGNVGDDDAYEPDSLTTADDDNIIDTELPPLFTSDSNDDNVSVTEPDSLTTTADDDNISVTEPDSLTTTADDDNVIDTELPPLFTSDSDDTDNTDDEEIVEPVVEPGEEDDDSTIITIDGKKYYDGLKYLNKISDEMPAVATESRLSLVDALYA